MEDPVVPPPPGLPATAPFSREELERARVLSRRRRLLKGLMAAGPAVMTLASGRDAAADTTKFQCFQDTSPPSTRCVTASGGPPYGDLTNTEGDYKMLPETSFSGSPDLSGGNGTSGNGTSSDLCVVYVDSDGVVASANSPATGMHGANSTSNGPPASGYYAITASCWASFGYN
ncbi:MAG: hypothetical protein H7831_05950 [Magnetococcus sp. WYHC-3]